MRKITRISTLSVELGDREQDAQQDRADIQEIEVMHRPGVARSAANLGPGKVLCAGVVPLINMKRLGPPDPYVEAKLLGILLAGAFAQTRSDCSAQHRLRQELRPSGVQRIPVAKPDPERKA